MSPDWLKHPNAKALVTEADGAYGIPASSPSAGRDLDALVAEKVMGLVWEEHRCRICGWPFDVGGVDGGCLPGNCSMRPRPKQHADEPAHYSTEIAAAWLVVERLAGQGHFFHVARYTAAPPGSTETELRETWRATFFRDGGPDTWAENAPLAICRAALAVVA